MCFYFVVAKSRRSYQRPADNLEWWFMAPLQLKILWHKASIISIFSVTIKENSHLTLRKGEGYGFFFTKFYWKYKRKKSVPVAFNKKLWLNLKKKCWFFMLNKKSNFGLCEILFYSGGKLSPLPILLFHLIA